MRPQDVWSEPCQREATYLARSRQRKWARLGRRHLRAQDLRAQGVVVCSAADTRETAMSKNDKTSEALPDMTAMLAQSVEQARGAMTNYFQFLQKSMSGSPWA